MPDSASVPGSPLEAETTLHHSLIPVIASLVAAVDTKEAVAEAISNMFTHWGIKEWEDLYVFGENDIEDYVKVNAVEELKSPTVRKKLGFVLQYAGISTLDPSITMRGIVDAVKQHNFNLSQNNLYHHVMEAYDVEFTIIRNNLQADGLRKLLTESAHRNNAFYPNTDTTLTRTDLHDRSFKSLEVPIDANLSGFAENLEETAPRLLLVHLIFFSLESFHAFEGDVFELLERRPSTKFFDLRLKCVSKDQTKGCQCQTTTLPKVPLPRGVHYTDYFRRQQPASPPNDSLDWCDLTTTATSSALSPSCFGNFNKDDPLWPFQALEHEKSFRLHADKAHIFPHKMCIKYEKKKQGQGRIKINTGYEWLDDPSNAEFNFLYVSKDMHVFFDGTTGNGRASRDPAQRTICIEPGARMVDDSTGAKRFKIYHDETTNKTRGEIPLRIWCVSEEVARALSSMLTQGAELHRDDSTNLPYFTNVFIRCVHRMIHMEPDVLFDGASRQRVVVYSKKVPFMDDTLSGAWSLNRTEGRMSSVEIMEKCLLWSANETWNSSWKKVVKSREFSSQEG